MIIDILLTLSIGIWVWVLCRNLVESFLGWKKRTTRRGKSYRSRRVHQHTEQIRSDVSSSDVSSIPVDSKPIQKQGVCRGCGKSIPSKYQRCYRCYFACKSGHWHDPECLPQLDERDFRYNRSEFYVYVLWTTYGHYVGHTWNTSIRFNDHVNGRVFSTVGGCPKLVWRSKPFPTRHDAAKFEAAMKCWRDTYNNNFQLRTGTPPIPFRPPHARG